MLEAAKWTEVSTRAEFQLIKNVLVGQVRTPIHASQMREEGFASGP